MILTPVFAPKNKHLVTIAYGIVYGLYTINIEETQRCAHEKSKNGYLYNSVNLVIGTKEEPSKSILFLTLTQWSILQREITRLLCRKKKATEALAALKNKEDPYHNKRKEVCA